MPDSASKTLGALLLTPQLGRAAGGVAEYLRGLVEEGLRDQDIRVTLAGTIDPGDEQLVSSSAATVIAAPPFRALGSRYGVSRSLGRELASVAPSIDVVHAQGLRTGTGFETLRLARRHRLPYLLTPHGMFHPQLRGGWSPKRALIDLISDRKYIAGATCIHATSELEARMIRDAGVKRPIAIVPIGVRTDALVPRARGFLDERLPGRAVGKRRVLFLGILNRKKGLLRLIEAWHALGDAAIDWSLLIAGPDDAGHRAEVEVRVAELNLSKAVTFLGPVWEQDKYRLLADIDLFVLPTDWENFGIVIAEACAAGLPVITTRGAPWADLQTHNCGWWIEAEVDALTVAPRDAMRVDDAERAAMGVRGRLMVQATYAWPAIGAKMAALYRWIAGRGDRPEFVYDA